ncbi:Gfo/Idh/MocA family oxidoreductase [Sphingomonas sp.]|uniref:Gfo/Idh/MocA family oxidoreductase n=1 Tax=Sphingomonas sp. TaxID=28214 RepID=UPI0025D486F9|nr:Gfo/Idh/MocA family oxidoreductase [Sphingomonas sp.]
MRIFTREEIVAALDETAALAAVERAIVAFAAGQAQSGDAGHFSFPAPGDAHVKVAHLAGEDVFALKVSASFYGNPAKGLSSSQGFSAVMSATTGEALALFADGGWLTDVRTAMAGAIAARAIGYEGGTLGIVGAGIQARMQAEMIRRHLGADRVLIWGRDPAKARALAVEIGGEAYGELADLVRASDLVVTTTPSTEWLIDDAWVQPGTRIVAVGSDGGGKRELDPRILGRATVIADSVDKCLENGEAGWAVRSGLLAADALVPLGALLAEPRVFAADVIVVADLTGLPVQDAAIAGAVWRALASS